MFIAILISERDAGGSVLGLEPPSRRLERLHLVHGPDRQSRRGHEEESRKESFHDASGLNDNTT